MLVISHSIAYAFSSRNGVTYNFFCFFKNSLNFLSTSGSGKLTSTDVEPLRHLPTPLRLPFPPKSKFSPNTSVKPGWVRFMDCETAPTLMKFLIVTFLSVIKVKYSDKFQSSVVCSLLCFQYYSSVKSQLSQRFQS